MYYYGARYYDPEIGRFISVDPVRDGLNWYVYCYDNPLRYVDRDGRQPGAVAQVIWSFGALPQLDGPLPFGDAFLLGALGGAAIYDSIINIRNRYLAEKTDQAVDKLLKGTTPGRETKGKSKQYDKTGDYNTALKDFEVFGE